MRPSGGGGVANDEPGAGEGDGFGLARFGEGGEVIRGVAVKVGDPQFTLIWDTDADLDLHVIEPGGKEIYWEEPKGKQGGELDVDNTKGFGPENIYWLVESTDQAPQGEGTGPPGQYQWFVVYWGGFGGIPKPTHWKVRIKHDGKVTVVKGKFRALNERSRTYTLKIDPPGTRVGFGEPNPRNRLNLIEDFRPTAEDDQEREYCRGRQWSIRCMLKPGDAVACTPRSTAAKYGIRESLLTIAPPGP